MNELVYRNLSEDAKRQICAWKYGGEYDLYNLPAYEEMHYGAVKGLCKEVSCKHCLQILQITSRLHVVTDPYGL